MQKGITAHKVVSLYNKCEFRKSTLHSAKVTGWFFYVLMADQINKGQQRKNEHSKGHQVLKIKFHLHHLPSYVK